MPFKEHNGTTFDPWHQPWVLLRYGRTHWLTDRQYHACSSMID